MLKCLQPIAQAHRAQNNLKQSEAADLSQGHPLTVIRSYILNKKYFPTLLISYPVDLYS